MPGCIPARGAHELHPGRLRQHTRLPAQVLRGLHGQQVLRPLQVQDHQRLLPVPRWAWLLPAGALDQRLLLQPDLSEPQ